MNTTILVIQHVVVIITSLPVLRIAGPKSTLAASAAPDESRSVCAARCIKVRKKMGQTDGRTPDSYITLPARRGLHTK